MVNKDSASVQVDFQRLIVRESTLEEKVQVESFQVSCPIGLVVP